MARRYRFFKRKGGPVAPLTSAAPYTSYWIHPVNQPIRTKKYRQQPVYPTNEPFYSITQGTIPSVERWIHPPVMPSKRKGKVIGVGGGQISNSVQAPYVSYWIHQVNQPVRRARRAQQPQPQQNPYYSIAQNPVIIITSWLKPFINPIRRLKRQQPPAVKPPFPAANSQAPYLSNWVHPTNQPYRYRVKRQQTYRGLPSQQPSQAPYLSYWLQPKSQPVRRAKRPQQPAPAQNPYYSIVQSTVIILTSWVKPFINPIRRIKRQQPNYNRPPVSPLQSQAPYISYWYRQVNQPLKSSIKRRTQQGRLPLVMPSGSVATPPLASWLQPKSQPTRRKPHHQPPSAKQSVFYSIVAVIVPILTSWIHPVNQPLRKYAKHRSQPIRFFNNLIDYPFVFVASIFRTIYLSILKANDVNLTVIQQATNINVISPANVNIIVISKNNTISSTAPSTINLIIVQQVTGLTVIAQATTIRIT